MPCPICLEEENRWKGHVTSQCGHTVCYPCFSRLRETNQNPHCPLCRARYLQEHGGSSKPSPVTLRHATRIGREQGKPVSMEYFAPITFIGIDSTSSRKVLVRSRTVSSEIQKMYKTPSEYIIVTVGTVYIVPGTIRKICLPALL